MITFFVIVGIIFLVLGMFGPMLSPEGGGVNVLKLGLWLLGIASMAVAGLIYLVKLLF